MEKVAFIGLGAMGYPMAGHLARRFPTLVWNRTFEKALRHQEEFGSEAVPLERVAEARVIFTCLPTTREVYEVAEALYPYLREGTYWVDATSGEPEASRRLAERLREKGVTYLDAPVSGGEVGAKAASLTIMIGGDEAVFERIKPLFELMGKNITLVGGNGDGQTTKVANQIIVALNIAAVGEALVFASKAGADPARVRQALMGGFASSRVLEVHGERMIKRTFNPGFRIELHQKDLNLALSGARALHISLPNTATCQELFNACAANGGSAWDHSAMVRALEMLAKHEIK